MKVASRAWVAALRERLKDQRDERRAAAMAAYLKDRFPFFGIGTTERRAVLKAFLAEQGGAPEGKELREIVRLLWREPERELHYCAQELLERRLKELGPEDFPQVESLIESQSWWDTVDFIAPKLAGGILFRHRELLAEKNREWVDSGHLWLQRTALLCQLKWKTETDTAVLSTVIEATKDSSEFFLRKAIGWALREYAKTNPDWVREFVERSPLSGLSRREALKHLAE